MSLLNRLFGSKEAAPAKGGSSLEARLEKLEAEAEAASPGHKGTPLNKAGDFALRDGDRERALRYYGRAIDTFLADHQREAARGVANKLIRVHPEAVRTLCTLTWLDLGARHMATAILHLRDYVGAATRIDRQLLAGDQIFEMARIAPQEEFLQAAADALDALDQSDRASEVRAWISTGGSPDVVEDPDDLGKACLEGAIRSNTGTTPSDGGVGDAMIQPDDPFEIK